MSWLIYINHELLLCHVAEIDIEMSALPGKIWILLSSFLSSANGHFSWQASFQVPTLQQRWGFPGENAVLWHLCTWPVSVNSFCSFCWVVVAMLTSKIGMLDHVCWRCFFCKPWFDTECHCKKYRLQSYWYMYCIARKNLMMIVNFSGTRLGSWKETPTTICCLDTRSVMLATASVPVVGTTAIPTGQHILNAASFSYSFLFCGEWLRND